MNRPIVRLYGLVVVLFALLVAFTSRWTIFEAELAAPERAEPARAAAAGTHRARQRSSPPTGRCSRAACAAAKARIRRTYPTGSLFAQTIGYSYTDLGQSGLERYRNPPLDGETSATNLQAILDQLQGKRRQGDEVITTLDPAAQRTAIAALGEHRGAVVALDPAHRRGQGDGLDAELRPQPAALLERL